MERRSDIALMRAARTDSRAFGELYERHAVAIHGWLRNRVGEPAATDLTAETFAAAWQSRRKFRSDYADSVAPWLYGIASNLIARHGRAESRRYRAMAKVPPDMPVSEIDVAGRLDAATARGRLAAALARLSGSDRDVLLLVAWAGLSQPEVATALDVPAGTVRSRLHRARQEMRLALREGDLGEGDLG